MYINVQFLQKRKEKGVPIFLFRVQMIQHNSPQTYKNTSIFMYSWDKRINFVLFLQLTDLVKPAFQSQ